MDESIIAEVIVYEGECMEVFEVNFDGLVGPTHNYAGLSYGNVASTNHKSLTSRPKEAALQGLSKMYALYKLGFKQALLPPHPRPHLGFLSDVYAKKMTVSDVQKMKNQNPGLFQGVSSAAAMWTANAATIAPFCDTLDGKTHLTPANLVNKFHRSIEAAFTYQVLKQIFNNENFFTVHSPLPAFDVLGDEGAANHTRLCTDYSQNV